MGVRTWTDDDMTLLRKYLDYPIAEIQHLFPTKTYWAIVHQRGRVRHNRWCNSGGETSQENIRAFGGDGIPQYVLKLLYSCTYSYACKHRGQNGLS